MAINLQQIFSRFSADGTFFSGNSFGSGHIHDTFLIETLEQSKDNFILQRLNNKIFKNIPELQENIERVTFHLQNKHLAIPGSDIKRECLTLIPSLEGKSWTIDDEGGFWRMYIYISNHRSYNIVDSPEKAYEGGKAIGRFQAMLADLPGKPLYETIPSFHDIEKRLETFYTVVKNNTAGRVQNHKAEIDFILKRSEEMRIILQMGRDGKIPKRTTHNDTKFNNILLNENDKALCVIDIDTVMPGFIHYDFGDAIRTVANIASEDEKDLNKVRMDISLYESYTKGYLSEANEMLYDYEKEYLAFSPRLMTYTMALRFLTDYLDGDHYYKIHHPDHNLQRSRAQMRLIESMEEQYDTMQKIIGNLVRA